MTITKNAYAKINLHLDITSIMSNGFHSVNNVMQSVSLCDRVSVSQRNDGECHISCNIDNIPLGTDNIATRAFLEFCAHTKQSIGADIFIDKHIPMAAGLAGGSADAAGTLLAVNELCGNILSLQELCQIGSLLGADVPFCIVGGSAIADGKGDILHLFPSMPNCTIVISKGGDGVSTPEAYRMLDSIYDNFKSYTPRSTEPLKIALQNANIHEMCQNMFNIFEEPILAIRPIAKQIKDVMLASGANNAMMSGSGPSVFGIFENDEGAQIAVKNIQKHGYQAHICHPI